MTDDSSEASPIPPGMHPVPGMSRAWAYCLAPGDDLGIWQFTRSGARLFLPWCPEVLALPIYEGRQHYRIRVWRSPGPAPEASEPGPTVDRSAAPDAGGVIDVDAVELNPNHHTNCWMNRFPAAVGTGRPYTRRLVQRIVLDQTDRLRRWSP